MKIKVALAVAIAATCLSGVAAADTSSKKIALSNNYAGNSWRQAMLKSWDKVTTQAVADRSRRRCRSAFTTAENQVTEQAAQIQNLILQGYDAIVVNAASPDGAQRRRQGSLRCGRHGRVLRRHRDRALRLAHRGRLQARWARTRWITWPTRCPKGGNLLEIRGLAGVFVDDEISQGHRRGRRRSTRSSRSSARCMATGRRKWRRRRLPASCPRFPKSRRRDAGR